MVMDANGTLERKIGFPGGVRGFKLHGLEDGWFLAGITGGTGHVALYRPDGTEAKRLITKGNMGSTVGTMNETYLRHDMTGWTSPTAMAVDPINKIIVCADCTMAPRDDRNLPDLDWSRIALWDFDGKYIGDFNRFDAYASDAKENDAKRTWYYTLAVDGESKRIYTILERYRRLVCYDYQGKELASAEEKRGRLCMLPGGRVALASGNKVTIFDRDLKELETLTVPAHPLCFDMSIRNIAADATGRLYLVLGDQAVKYARWSADFQTFDVFLLDHLRVVVGWPGQMLTVGGEVSMKVRAQGQPAPAAGGTWQIMVRPSDGSSLEWQVLPSEYDGETQALKATLPGNMEGYYEFAVRYGQGPIDWTNRANDPYLQRRLLVLPKESPSVSVVTTSLRSAFRQGERIGLQVVRRGGRDTDVYGWVQLTGPGLSLRGEDMVVPRTAAMEIPAEITRRLAPGDYTLTAHAGGHKSYALPLHIASERADSPMQRILYHEFGPGPSFGYLADGAEQAAYLRQYFEAARRQGWTRETDRAFAGASNGGSPQVGNAWPWGQEERDVMPIGERFAPFANDRDRMMDLMTRWGMDRDSQVLGHCASPRFRESQLQRLAPAIARFAQANERHPSFYGVNYNDEMFFDNIYDNTWTQADTEWLDSVNKEQFPGRPRADAYRLALDRMYSSFNTAVKQAVPRARTTTTPMWQFPAVDGSYAPTMYAGMDESYSHFLSEGMHVPFYALHSVELLRRPGKPIMGVFDNAYAGEGGDVYMKNAMLVLSRGVQGVGVQHTTPLGTPSMGDMDPFGADAYRVTNLLAAMYGPVFAEFPLADEAAVLYSYEQDITEHRNSIGTPQFEGAYAMLAAGAMAGLPMRMVYEEDVAADVLLNKDGTVKIPMLFIVGVKVDFPEATRAGIAKYVAAGGKVYVDSVSKDYPNATRLDFQAYTDELRNAFRETYCCDSWYPTIMPTLELLAGQLHKAVGDQRRLPVDTSDPFVGKSFFDGGAITYVMLANETSPYPWDGPMHWSMGGMYNKRFLPKSVTLTLPTAPKMGVLYDVFEHKVVSHQLTLAEGPLDSLRSHMTVDLRNFPGRLYAMAPTELGSPALAVQHQPGGGLRYDVHVADKDGKRMLARVPLRVRLMDSAGRELECLYRGSDDKGRLLGQLTLPLHDKSFTLEVCELLGGRASKIGVESDEPATAFVKPRPPVEASRIDRIEALLKESGGTIMLATDALNAHQKTYLTRALEKRKIKLVEARQLDALGVGEQPAPGVYLAAWFAGRPTDNPLIRAIVGGGLLSWPITANLPGPGNSIVSAVFGPRGWQEHCIAIVAGDELGMSRAVDELVAFIEQRPSVFGDATAPAPPPANNNPWIATWEPAQATLPSLSEMTGITLGAVHVSQDGKRLLVSAPGYQRNLALLQDDGNGATLVKSVRLGQGPEVASLFITNDGKTFGGANTFAQPWTQGVQLFNAGGEQAGGKTEIVASFGEYGKFRNLFAVSGDGQSVVAPGPYGVVCWHRNAETGAWSEAWAIDYWKEFDKLTWPISTEFMRIPRFNAYIPPKADFVIVAFSELSAGWVMPRFPGKASLTAYDLKTGQRKWHFDVPIPDALLFVELFISPTGQRLLLQAQQGSWGQESYRYYSMNLAGEVLGTWEAKTPPASLALSDSGRVVSLYKDRLVEVRDEKGRVLVSRLWDNCHPLTAAYINDTVFLTDDSGVLSRLNGAGQVDARADLGGVARLTAGGNVLYAALWNGRLASFTFDLQPRWSMDLTAHLTDADPVAALADSMNLDGVPIVQAQRASTTSADVPAGENLLAGGDKATVRVGGTPGWLSGGRVTVKPEQLINGLKDDVTTPWVPIGDLDNDATAQRQVWVEVEFKQPTDVKTVTVYENPKFPASFPREAQIMIWNDQTQDWDTVTHSVFMKGPINTYTVNRQAVTKLRYVPWHSYWRNFYTSEIEIR